MRGGDDDNDNDSDGDGDGDERNNTGHGRSNNDEYHHRSIYYHGDGREEDAHLGTAVAAANNNKNKKKKTRLTKRQKICWGSVALILIGGMIATPVVMFTMQSRGLHRHIPDKKSMGPVVGHTTHDSVTLWAYYHDDGDHQKPNNKNNNNKGGEADDGLERPIEIRLYDSETGGLLRTREAVPRPDRNGILLETLRGLSPSTSYRYGFFRGDTPILGTADRGSFSTAPVPPPPLSPDAANNTNNNSTNNNGTRFEYVLASCIDRVAYPKQFVWDAIVGHTNNINTAAAAGYPAFALLVGDTVYLREGTDLGPPPFGNVIFGRVWYRHQEQRREGRFRRFARNTPVYATWNNHDYGANVADKDQPGKDESLRAWRTLWAAHPDPPHHDDDGVYYSFYHGDVHYLVTDDHWNRDPSTGNRLGKRQTDWIEDELVRSRGTFKIIVIGSDILQRGWSSDLENIGSIVREHSVPGVLFHAGDIHRNEYKRRNAGTGGFPYPVTQITSSGIAKVWRRPFALIAIDTTLDDPAVTARFFGAESRTNDGSTAWKNDPALACSSLDREEKDRASEHVCTETIYLSELTVP